MMNIWFICCVVNMFQQNSYTFYTDVDGQWWSLVDTILWSECIKQSKEKWKWN